MSGWPSILTMASLLKLLPLISKLKRFWVGKGARGKTESTTGTGVAGAAGTAAGGGAAAAVTVSCGVCFPPGVSVIVYAPAVVDAGTVKLNPVVSVLVRAALSIVTGCLPSACSSTFVTTLRPVPFRFAFCPATTPVPRPEVTVCAASAALEAKISTTAFHRAKFIALPPNSPEQKLVEP